MGTKVTKQESRNWRVGDFFWRNDPDGSRGARVVTSVKGSLVKYVRLSDGVKDQEDGDHLDKRCRYGGYLPDELTPLPPEPSFQIGEFVCTESGKLRMITNMRLAYNKSRWYYTLSHPTRDGCEVSAQQITKLEHAIKKLREQNDA